MCISKFVVPLRNALPGWEVYRTLKTPEAVTETLHKPSR